MIMLMEWILSASALTAAVLILRLIFRRRVTQRLMYALWLPVLIRLLLPVSLYRAPVSVPAAAERLAPAVFAAAAPAATPNETARPATTAAAAAPAAPLNTPYPAPAVTPGQSAAIAPAPAAETAPPTPAGAEPMDWGRLLPLLWLCGSILLGLWLLAVNLAFWQRLKRSRTLLRAGRTPVYVTDAAASPCLFGLFRPAVYLTPQAAALEEERLGQVLAHEHTHKRQLDHVWNLLRCLALAAWWWNPLVWAAAICSRRDSELSCDEQVLRQLGEERRLGYGHTLVDLAPKKAPGAFLCAATVSGGGKALRERLERITKKPRAWAAMAALAVLFTALIVGCAFGGKGKEDPAPAPVPETALLAEEGRDWLTLPEGARWLSREELEDWAAWLNADWMRGQFLTSSYARPEDVDLHELFYLGVDLEETEYPDTASLNPVTREDLRNYLFRLGWIDPEKTLDKLPRQQADALLRKYLGLGLEDTALVGFDFSYVPETDCFYRLRGPWETNRRFPQILYGYALGEETCLYYAPDAYEQELRGVEAAVSRLRLRTGEGETRFLANQPVLRRGEDYVYETPEAAPGSLDLSGNYGRDITVLYLRGTVSEEERRSFKSVRGWGYPGSGTLNYGETEARGEYGPDSCLWFQTQERLYRLPTPVYTLDGATVDADLGDGEREEEYVLQVSGSYAPPLLRWTMSCAGAWDLGGKSGYRQDLKRMDGRAFYTLDLDTLEIFLYFRPEEEEEEPTLTPAAVPEPVTPGDLSVTTVEGPEPTPAELTDGTRSAVFTLDRDGYAADAAAAMAAKEGLRVSGTSPEEIAEAYNARRWESLETLPPDNRCGILRFALLHLEVKAGEADSYFYAYALTAVQPNFWNGTTWWAENGADAAYGEYSGWLLYGLYYRLERREGYWICTETAGESSPLFQLPLMPLTGAELSYRGVSIGYTVDGMRAVLGEPEEVTEHLYSSEDPPQGLEYREYRYGGAVYREAYTESEGWTGVIGQIEIWDTSAAPGPRGILLGESPESVMDLFPREYDYREDAYYRFYGELWHMGAGGCVDFGPNGDVNKLVLTTDALEPSMMVYFEEGKAVRIFLGYNWI